jgi:cytidine deaminase
MAAEPHQAELFIGLVARIGIDTKMVFRTIERLLREFDYESVEIKVTDALREIEGYEKLPTSPTQAKYVEHINACNEVRKRTERNNVMAQFAISRITFEREKQPNPTLNKRRAFVINQLKRPEECDLLRKLYGENYVQISCHAKAAEREARLADLISHDHPRKPKATDHSIAAKALMLQDEAEEDIDWGQRLRDIFPMSDVVIDASNSSTSVKHLDRFFRALFSDPRVTPTVDEYGMQLARTASLRSADLSRQVGASILNNRAEVQALGCNEVPRAHGGTYWEGDPHDGREFRLGRDSNDERKKEVLLDIAIRMGDAGLLKPKFKDSAKLRDALLSRSDELIEDAQLMDSLEYGRTVHAEMNAITDAARGGHAIRGCTLYCNTFPCHNCAKHIVAAGIERVVYLVPYPKSYAEELFADSIVVDPPMVDPDRVNLEQFVGIAGPMYGRVFEKRRWKQADGTVRPFVKKTANFTRQFPAPAYGPFEVVLREELADLLAKSGLRLRKPVRSRPGGKTAKRGGASKASAPIRAVN